MINKKTSIVVGITLIFLLVGIPMLLFKHKKPAQQAMVMTGLTKGQQKTFQQDLTGAMKQFGYVKKGDRLLAEGKFDDALAEYQTALSRAKSASTKGEALRSLANLYEKKRDYKKALDYMRLEEQTYISDWAKSPVIERIKYLEYASNGEYDLAVEFAKKAIEAEANLPDSNGKPRKDYVHRLNDIIAAKDYILSLKKKE